MIYKLFAMRDEKSTFMQIMMEYSDGTAMRNFQQAVTKPDTVYSSFAYDFALYCLGVYDTETGIITPENPPVLLARASDFKEGVDA